jgi:hypothetical protein
MSTVWDNSTWNTADSKGERVGPIKIGRPRKKELPENKSECAQINKSDRSICSGLQEIQLHH